MLDTFEHIPVSTRNDNEYAIYVGEGVFEHIDTLLDASLSRSSAFVIIDERVQQLHGERIQNILSEIFPIVHIYTVPSGEQSKHVGEFSKIVDFVLEHGVTRKTPLFAIGGGVTGDLAGYVAASVLRGIPLIHVPTTLLAMVDSSIGGKTGINHATGKNLIGAFYQPRLVVSDIHFLATLPQKEWANGLSEILKYAAIRTPRLFNELRTLTENGSFADPKKWISVIKESASIKVHIVEEDVLEAGVREFLNFGHTFAHAIENATGYGAISHGEAVYAGMYSAMYASNELGADINIDELRSFKSLYSMELTQLESNIDTLIELMKRDKKVKDGSIRLVLLSEMGKPIVKPVSDLGLVTDAWKFMIPEFG